MIIQFNYDELPLKFSPHSVNNSIDNILLERWKCLHDNTDVFRYKLTPNKQKILDGKYGFILQLNTDRCIKGDRLLPLKQLAKCLIQRCSILIKYPQKRLFYSSEILMRPYLCLYAPHKGECPFTMKPCLDYVVKTTKRHNAAKHLLVINDSPINFGHSLLCPYIDDNLPQVITFNSLVLISHFMFLCSDRSIRVGFNSLCGFASVNHLHYHVLSIDGHLPVEKAKSKHLIGNLYCTEDDYPAPAFSFQITTKKDIEHICKDVDKLIALFISLNVAHNVCFTRKYCSQVGGDVLRIYIWARENCQGAKELLDLNVAICELSGYFPIYSQESFEKLNEEEACSILRRWADASFHQVLSNVMQLYS